MSHIPCHNKTADRRSRSKHHQNRNHLFIPKSKKCRHRQKNHTKSNQLHKHSNKCSFIFDVAFFISKVAPIDISPIGVAVAPILDTVLCKIDGIGSLSADQTNPATIPIMIGFVCNPLQRFLYQRLIKRIIPRFKH